MQKIPHSNRPIDKNVFKKIIMHSSSKNCIFNSGLSIKDFNKDLSDDEGDPNDFNVDGLYTPLPEINL